jgi:hypothetical protein
MNKLMCFLTGGHKFEDKNINSYRHQNPNFITIHNKCIKCGKEFEFEFNYGIQLQKDLERLKGKRNDKS